MGPDLRRAALGQTVRTLADAGPELVRQEM